jgi:hypothetical protein
MEDDSLRNQISGRVLSHQTHICKESAPMPNGGPDNCGTCGFNRRNRGIWRNPEPDEMQISLCEIRGVAVLADHWTYCQNWHSNSREPIGPIYASGVY